METPLSLSISVFMFYFLFYTHTLSHFHTLSLSLSKRKKTVLLGKIYYHYFNIGTLAENTEDQREVVNDFRELFENHKLRN